MLSMIGLKRFHQINGHIANYGFIEGVIGGAMIRLDRMEVESNL